MLLLACRHLDHEHLDGEQIRDLGEIGGKRLFDHQYGRSGGRQQPRDVRTPHMAITKCKECGKDVSTQAATCPHCGAPQPKRTSGCAKIVALFAIVFVGLPFVVTMCIQGTETPTTPTKLTHAPPPPQPKSPAQIASEAEAAAKQRDADAARLTDEERTRGATLIATITAKELRSAMRNPDSFVLEEVLMIDGTHNLCFSYRAQNGFGGMNRERAVVDMKSGKTKLQSEGGFEHLWNTHCAGKRGTIITDNVKTAAGL